MYKLSTLIFITTIFTACSNFTINPQICENSALADNNIPTECKVYMEEKAKKAFNKVSDDKKTSNENILKYNKK